MAAPRGQQALTALARLLVRRRTCEDEVYPGGVLGNASVSGGAKTGWTAGS